MQPSSQSPQIHKPYHRWLPVLVWLILTPFVLCWLLVWFLDSQPASEKPLFLGDGAYAYDPIDLARVRPRGSPVTLADLRITLLDARPLTALPGWNAPRPDSQFWVVDVIFENRSASQPLSLNLYGLWIQASKARAQHYSARRSLKQSLDDGIAALYSPLQPGAVVHTTLIHEVPSSTDGLLWVYYGGETQPPSQNIAAFTIKE
jgi:hypothetical protein